MARIKFVQGKMVSWKNSNLASQIKVDIVIRFLDFKCKCMKEISYYDSKLHLYLLLSELRKHSTSDSVFVLEFKVDGIIPILSDVKSNHQ